MTVPTTWFEALGHPVNEEGRAAATALLVEHGYHAGNARLVVDYAAYEVEKDEPERAIKHLRSFIYDPTPFAKSNETLVLMACAVLCTQEAVDA